MKKKNNTEIVFQHKNNQIGLFDEGPKSKDVPRDFTYDQTLKIRKKLTAFHTNPPQFSKEQPTHFKSKIIKIVLNKELFPQSFISTLNNMFKNEKTLLKNIEESELFEFIFLYAGTVLFNAIQNNDVLSISPMMHPKLEYTEKMWTYGPQMEIVKEIDDLLNIVYKYISNTGLGSTDNRSIKQDLKHVYSIYTTLHINKDASKRVMLFICVGLFITHERITSEIVDDLLSTFSAATYKTEISDPRLFLRIAKKTGGIENKELLTLLHAYINTLLEDKNLPEI